MRYFYFDEIALLVSLPLWNCGTMKKATAEKWRKSRVFPNKISFSSALAFLTRSHFSACVNWNISRARVRRYYKIQKISARALNHLQKREDISTKREEEKVKIYTHAKEHYLLTLNMIILNISTYNINFSNYTTRFSNGREEKC